MVKLKKALTFFGWPLLLLPTAVVYFGIGLNALCTKANGGVMPMRTINCRAVFAQDKTPDLIHSCMTKKTRMKPLADVITQGSGIVSVGDEFQDIGAEISNPVYLLWGFVGVVFLIRREKCHL